MLKRNSIITTLLFILVHASATTYYVSNSGSDANNGTSSATAWQTISKVNAFAFVANDSILFKRGDTWIEKLNNPNRFLHYADYGAGNKPLITGLQTVTGFTQSGNIWTATATNSVKNLNCVLLNGQLAIKARTPNTGYLTFNSYSGDSILNTSETGTPSRVAKEIVVRTATFIIDVSKVVTQSTGQLKLYPKLTAVPALLGNGYFFQNDVSFIDVPNEYSYDSASKSLSVYSTTTPTVQISVFDTVVKCKKGTTFDNIAITGGNNLIVQVDTLTAIKNCRIQYGGWDGIQGDNIRDGLIDNDSILNVFNNGIMYGFVNHIPGLTITNNLIKKIGYAEGMGRSGNGTYTGILFFSDSSLIEYNRIDSIGYNAIHFTAANVNIKHNYITNFGFVKVDAGGIYTFAGGANNLIRGNIVGNGLGNTAGITGNNIANGIYLDDFTQGQTIDSNIVFNCKWASCFVHVNPAGSTFTNNLFEDSVDRPFYNNGGPGMIIKKNIFYSRNASNDAFYSDNTTSQVVDSNYYIRQTSPNGLIHWSGSVFNYNTFTNDVHAMSTPLYGNTNISCLLLINPTKNDSTIALDVSKTYVDVKGKIYTNSIKLKPYQQALLFTSTLDILPRIYITSIR